MLEDQEIEFEKFKDDYSTFLSIPMSVKRAGLSKPKITHEAYKRNG